MTGREKSALNRPIRNDFESEIDDVIISSSIDSRGYVTDYHLPETESIMLAAKLDQEYLRKIAEFWKKRKEISTPQNFGEALDAAAHHWRQSQKEREGRIDAECRAAVSDERALAHQEQAHMVSTKRRMILRSSEVCRLMLFVQPLSKICR